MIPSENAFEPEYLDFIRNPANDYISQAIPIDEARGNAFTVKVS